MILSMSGGGAERQLAGLASELGNLGHDLHLAYVYPGPNLNRLTATHLTLHHLGDGAARRPLVIARAVSLLRGLRPDVLHTWLTHMDIVGGIASRMLGVPWVMSERSSAGCYPRTLMNRIRIAAGKRADIIVPNSEGGASYWMGQGVDAHRVEVVPNFVSIDEIETALPIEDCRVIDGDELIVHIGRLNPEKNLELLIDSLPHVLQVRPRARVAFCGDGPLRDDLAARARALGIADRVIFAGFVPNVASWLKRASAVVAISRFEGLPNAVLEAVAARVPVIVSDIPAYRAILADDAACFVPEDQATAVAAALSHTLENHAAAEQRAARARSSLRTQSIEAIVTRYESVYRRAIAIARHTPS